MSQLAVSSYGELAYVNGELLNLALVDDPVAYRGGGRTRSLVKWSGDHIRADGVHEELVLDQYKRDEKRGREQGDWMCGEVTRHLRGPGQGGADTLIETVRVDGVTYHVPIIAAGGIEGTAIIGGRIVHEGGRYLTIFQGDGNIVTHTRDPVTGALGPPVWASGYTEP